MTTKIVTFLALIFQTLSYNPQPYLLYTMVGGVPTPVAGSGSAGALGYTPTPILAYCLSGGLSVPCTFTGGGGGGLTSFTTGNLAPLFTASLGGSPTTSPALAFTLSTAPANSVFGNFTGSTAAPTYSAAPVFSAANLTNFPTFNQGTTGNAATATLATNATNLAGSQTANFFYASPNGSAGVGAWRAMVPADMPVASSSAFGAMKCGTGTTCTAGVVSVSGSSGPNFNIPRDRNAHYEVVNPWSSTFNVMGGSNLNSAGTFTAVTTVDAAGYVSMQGTSTATINTPVGQSLTQAILPINNPTYQAIFHPSTAASVDIWLAMCSYCNVNLNGTADVGPSNIAVVGFRHFAAVEATNWTCYASDSTSGAAGTAMDSTVAVSTTQMQVFDVIYVANVPQFYINGTRVCAAFSATHLPGATVPMGAVAIWQNTTAAAVTANIFDLYFGAN